MEKHPIFLYLFRTSYHIRCHSVCWANYTFSIRILICPPAKSFEPLHRVRCLRLHIVYCPFKKMTNQILSLTSINRRVSTNSLAVVNIRVFAERRFSANVNTIGMKGNDMRYTANLLSFFAYKFHWYTTNQCYCVICFIRPICCVENNEFIDLFSSTLFRPVGPCF